MSPLYLDFAWFCAFPIEYDWQIVFALIVPIMWQSLYSYICSKCPYLCFSLHDHVDMHYKYIKLLPVLHLQTFLVWQLIFSVLILGRRYSYNQVLGCSLVIAGVVLAVARYNALIPSRHATTSSHCCFVFIIIHWMCLSN